MRKRVPALSLLFLVVLVSGCTTGPSNNQGKEAGKAIEVSKVSVQPREIYENTQVRASINVVNTGNTKARVILGEKGSKVLKDYCPDIFNITENGFTISTNGKRVGEKSQQVLLKPGRKLKLRWRLEQIGDVPLYGKKCPMEFELPFRYHVKAYKQVQIKRSKSISGSSQLSWESSSGPVTLAIDTIGSESKQGQSTFITGENTITALIQLQNTEAEDYSKGVVEVFEKSLGVKATPPLKFYEGFRKISGSSNTNTNDEEQLSNPQLRKAKKMFKPWGSSSGTNTEESWEIYGDYKKKRCSIDKETVIKMFEGESRVITCQIPIPSKIDSPSVISTISTQINYTYRKKLDSYTVEVKPRGGN